MQRWWFADDKANSKDLVPKCKKSPSKKSETVEKKWTFSVLVNMDLNMHEKVALTGDCDELGNWDPDGSLLLNQSEGMISVGTVSKRRNSF